MAAVDSSSLGGYSEHFGLVSMILEQKIESLTYHGQDLLILKGAGARLRCFR